MSSGEIAFVGVTACLLIAMGTVFFRLSRSRGDVDQAPPLTLGRALAVSAWCGLIAGIGESYYLLGRVALLRKVPSNNWTFGPETPWLAPLVSIAWFSLVGTVLWLAWAAAGRRVRIPLFAGLLLTMVFVTWIGQTGRLHGVPTIIFSAGLASVIVRSVTPGPAVAMLMRRTALVGAGLVALTVAGSLWSQAARHGQPEAGDPGAGDPNVVLIVLDTQRAASMSVHGGAAGTTPGLEDWAARGITFDRAFSTAPWTLPSHASMFTGRYNAELGTDPFTPLDGTSLTLAEALSRSGYRTGGFVGNLFYTTEFFGLARGFEHYRDHPATVGMLLVSSYWPRTVVQEIRHRMRIPRDFPEKPAEVVTRQALDWIGEGDDRPFFAFLNYMDAHAPYQPPDGTVTGDRLSWYHRGANVDRYSEAEIAALRRTYEAEITHVDREVDGFLTELEGRGLLEKTVVVITSDHGEAFGEHGKIGHSHSLYSEEVHVPLIVLLPDGAGAAAERGRSVLNPVSLRDLPATLMDLLGMETAFPGTSFLGSTRADTLMTELESGWWALTTPEHHFVRRPDGQEELYREITDPGHLRDLAASPDYSDALARLRDALDRRLFELDVVP